MNDHPAEYIVFGEEELWAMDAGSDTLVLQADKIINRLFLPGTQHMPMVLKNGMFYRGLFSGKIDDKSYETFDPFAGLADDVHLDFSPDEMAWEQIVWHPSGSFFAGALQPIKPRDGRERTGLEHHYPVMYMDTVSGKTSLLQQGAVPLDAIQFSSSYLCICRDACTVYDNAFQQLGSMETEEHLQIDRLILVDQQEQLAIINAEGQASWFQLPGLEKIATAVFEDYETMQPLVVTADNHLFTSNNNGELVGYQRTNTGLQPVMSTPFQEMITALAAHPTEKRIAMGLSGRKEGTFWLSWD